MNELSTRLHNVLQKPTFVPYKKGNAFHPSAASIVIKGPLGTDKVVGSCLRNQYYRMTAAPTSDIGEPDWTISSMIGDKLHEMLVEIIDNFGYQLGLQKIVAEHPFYSEQHNLSGRSDIIVYDFVNKEPIGIEVKTVGEYKAGKVIEKPADEHVMQAMLYLDHYQKKIPEGMQRPTKWYIWYVSRTENWTIKGKKHGSPFAMIWDFYITLNENGCPIIHSPTGNELWSGFSVDKIYKRYNDLKTYIDQNIVPPRDYELQYSEEKITEMYVQDLLTRKADKEIIAKWLKKGAEPGKLRMVLGDFECQLCQFKNLCWNGDKTDHSTEVFGLPQVDQSSESKPDTSFDTSFL